MPNPEQMQPQHPAEVPPPAKGTTEATGRDAVMEMLTQVQAENTGSGAEGDVDFDFNQLPTDAQAAFTVQAEQAAAMGNATAALRAEQAAADANPPSRAEIDAGLERERANRAAANFDSMTDAQKDKKHQADLAAIAGSELAGGVHTEKPDQDAFNAALEKHRKDRDTA